MKLNTALTGLLAAQTLLAVWAWYPRDNKVKLRPLVPFDELDRIQLESLTTRGSGGDLVLARVEHDWTVQSEHNFPAKSAPVQEMIDRLASLRLGRPITSDSAMHKMLNVAEENFSRRVTLYSGSETLEFLAGTATRERMHVRFPGEDDVYMVQGLGAWRMADSARAYLVKDAIETSTTDVASFTLTNPAGTITFARTEAGWDLPNGPAKAEEARRFIQKATNLDVAAVTDPSDPDPREAPDLTVSWTLIDGSTHGYHGRIQGQALNIRLQDDALPPFQVSPTDPQTQLLESTAETFALAPPEEDTQ